MDDGLGIGATAGRCCPLVQALCALDLALLTQPNPLQLTLHQLALVVDLPAWMVDNTPPSVCG